MENIQNLYQSFQFESQFCENVFERSEMLTNPEALELGINVVPLKVSRKSAVN
jgi:hypothetical protein